MEKEHFPGTGETIMKETMSISLPAPVREFVEARVAEGEYGTASEYVHDLICEDQKRRAEKKLEELLLEGLDSGPAVEVTAEWWVEFRSELDRELENQAKSSQSHEPSNRS